MMREGFNDILIRPMGETDTREVGREARDRMARMAEGWQGWVCKLQAIVHRALFYVCWGMAHRRNARQASDAARRSDLACSKKDLGSL